MTIIINTNTIKNCTPKNSETYFNNLSLCSRFRCSFADTSGANVLSKILAFAV